MATLTSTVIDTDCENFTVNFSITKLAGDTISNYNFILSNLTTEIDYTAVQSCFNSNITLTTNTSTSIIGSIVLPVTCFLFEDEDAGLTEIPDGVWNVTLEATSTNTGVDTTLSSNSNYLTTCTLCCKVKKLASEIDLGCESCSKSNKLNLYKFMEANGMLNALLYSGLCGSLDEVSLNIKNLEKFLLNINCKNC